MYVHVHTCISTINSQCVYYGNTKFDLSCPSLSPAQTVMLLDEKCWFMYSVLNMSTLQLLHFLYPRVYSLVSPACSFLQVKLSCLAFVYWLCVCVCVCDRETERQRDRETERERERESRLLVHVLTVYIVSCFSTTSTWKGREFPLSFAVRDRRCKRVVST